MTKQYAIILNKDNSLRTITIQAEELLHIAFIARGLTFDGSQLEAVAVQQDDQWVEVV